jgi:acyl-coenzyme A thioesterase PaaI-like protein
MNEESGGAGVAARVDKDARKAAMRGLAAEVRRLNEATVRSGVDPVELAAVSAAVRDLTKRLSATVHPGGMSGLLGEIDPLEPTTYTPLTPMAGQYNPIAPPIVVSVHGDGVRGTVTLGRQHSGPAGIAHGGSLASICDQLVGIAAWSAGLRAFTKNLRVSFLRPAPLDRQLDLVTWIAERTDDGARACAQISADGRTLVAAESDLVVTTYRDPKKAGA